MTLCGVQWLEESYIVLMVPLQYNGQLLSSHSPLEISAEVFLCLFLLAMFSAYANPHSRLK